MIEEFKTLAPGKVSMYVCGPTVYAKPHLGNARPMIVFDVLYRLFIHNFGIKHVKYVRNITDIDDKIINKAKELNCSIYDVTSKALAEFEYIQKELNILAPTDQPKATEYIERMCVIIKDLLDKGHAYINDLGDILFKVDTFTSYHFFQDNSQSQVHRINSTDKHSEEDFVLWKNVIDEDFEKYQFAWETPVYMRKNPDVKNFGRPGWHIECTAMSTAILGEKFDLHGGGSDLIAPHHQNERAQTCAYTCQDDCANYWMHNGMIQIDNGKMSKSLGNVLYLDEVCADFDPLSVRFYMLHTHYRHPLLWSNEILAQMHLKYTNVIKQIYIHAKTMTACNVTQSQSICDVTQKGFLYYFCPMYWINLFSSNSSKNTFSFAESTSTLEALSNDLNTPLAITNLLQHITKNQYEQAISAMYILGLLSKNIMNDIKTVSWKIIADNCLQWLQRRALTQEQKDLLQKRSEARAQQDYQQSDIIRKTLADQKILVEDTKDGYLWYVL